MRLRDRIHSPLAELASLVLVLALATQTWAQQVSPALLKAAQEAYQRQQKQDPKILPPAQQHPAQPRMSPASESDWDNLAQLQPGQRILVETMDNVRHRGTFVAYSDEAISLREDKRDVGYRRKEVLRVWRLGPPNRGKAAKIGFLSGFAVGAATAVIWWFSGDTQDGDEDYLVLLVAPAFGGLFGGVGAGLGAAVAPRSKTLIYRAP
ncbi:MAG: hypothetical protein ACE5H2_03660 [Terriglobia bacterium]